jgi:hypothetical protein
LLGAVAKVARDLGARGIGRLDGPAAGGAQLRGPRFGHIALAGRLLGLEMRLDVRESGDRAAPVR